MTRSCDDAAEALTHPPRSHEPDVTLSGFDAKHIFDALRSADAALREAEGSKLRNIREPARRAREQVTAAWARIDHARQIAARSS